jgi:4-amino-4-deoxy-L-arabinose transferase-like glycosyltransferase
VLSQRWPELLIVLVGLTVRLTMTAWDVGWSYDFDDHVPLCQWWASQWAWPSIELTRAAYHPPLYYMMCGGLLRAGVSVAGLGVFSIVCGALRFVTFLAALEVFLPKNRMARIVALAVCAVVPAAIHLEGMVTNESLAGLFAMIALVLVPLTFRAQGKRRIAFGGALGLVLGLGFLTKVSALVILGAIGIAALLEWRKLPLLAPGLAIFALVASPYVVHNLRTSGKAIVSGFDGPDRHRVEKYVDIPYWKRRPPSYFVAFTPAIFAHPYAPTAMRPDSRFWPQVVATTFVDYWNFGFAPYPLPGEPSALGNYKPLRPDVLAVSRPAMAGGTIIFLITTCALIMGIRSSLRRRNVEDLALCLVPLLAVAGQCHFATQFPNDSEGLVKGAYLQFAAPPLCALFGLALAWCWRTPRTRAITIVGCAALALVAFYTLYCRFAR